MITLSVFLAVVAMLLGVISIIADLMKPKTKWCSCAEYVLVEGGNGCCGTCKKPIDPDGDYANDFDGGCIHSQMNPDTHPVHHGAAWKRRTPKNVESPKIIELDDEFGW